MLFVFEKNVLLNTGPLVTASTMMVWKTTSGSAIATNAVTSSMNDLLGSTESADEIQSTVINETTTQSNQQSNVSTTIATSLIDSKITSTQLGSYQGSTEGAQWCSSQKII